MNNLYRPCAGIVLFNNDSKVFVGSRLDNTQQGVLQLPQGGVEADESFEEAALRELEEEVGVTNAKIIYTSKVMHKYDVPVGMRPWGEEYVGQIQKWFLLEFLGSDDEININTKDREFRDWVWINISDLPNVAIYFKAEIYRNIASEFEPIMKNYLSKK